jgi:FMN phosphatase YigB (HAD superfamily)
VIKAIIFDLGGVLVPEKVLFPDKISKILGISANEYESFLDIHKPALTKGEINLAQMYAKISEKSEAVIEEHMSIYKKNATKVDNQIL